MKYVLCARVITAWSLGLRFQLFAAQSKAELVFFIEEYRPEYS